MSKKLRDRVGACEPVEHGVVCVSERDALAVFAPQGKKPRSCGDHQLSEWGGTRCGTNHPGLHPGADPGGAFRDCDVRAAATSPARRPRGGILPDAGLTSSLWKPGRQGLGCQGELWTPSRVSQPSFGTGCLPEASPDRGYSFENLIEPFCCFFFPKVVSQFCSLLSCGVSS